MKPKIDILFQESPLVVTFKTEFNSLSSSISYLRGEALFIDMSKLFFFELWKNKIKEKYRYHYQDEKKALIFRYDNAPHFKNLKTFPHHKHLRLEVTASNIVTLHDVLKEIEEMILNKLAR